MNETIKNVSSATIEHIGRDFHVGDIVTTVNNYSSRKRKIQFDVVTTGDDVFADYPKPRFTEEIFGKARREGLVLIGGNNRFNKGQLLKYVAINLKIEGLEIKECADFDDFYSLSTAILEEENRSVFILYNLTAASINFRFRELKSLIQKKEHIILSSTENSYDSWLFNEKTGNESWFEVPERDIYSKETLQSYLTTSLKKKNLTLPVSTDKIILKLPKLEQLDHFVDIVSKLNKIDIKEIELALEISSKDDYASIEPWFYSLNQFNKLIVIGLVLFDGAYEEQVFAGFDRILQFSWKNRNKELRSIDYEDLIALRAYFKIEGKIIQSTFEHQRKKIIQIAWRTHKRYILSAIPTLLEIIYDSADKQNSNWELFGSSNRQIRIRNVLSETLSIIGLHSFEDINLPLLLIASKPSLSIQTITAYAISRWKLSDEDKIYEVLEMWQQDTAKGFLERSDVSNKESSERELLSNVRGCIAITLYFASVYDKTNNLSSRITDLLLKFLNNNEKAIIERMQYAVENITSRHPISMKDFLKEDFLQYPDYIAPVGNGFIKAYNNGLAHDVKNILTEWLKYCIDLKEKPEDRERFGHRESVLAAVIFTLKYIDYDTASKEISLSEAYKILENLRKSNHNVYIRKFLLDAIVNCIETMLHSHEKVNIDLISNIDAKEREYVVNSFREKYLTQRQELEGGDYITQYENHQFQTWSKADQRPKTPIESLLHKWKKGDNNVLSQIALQSLVDLQIIETVEKDLIEADIKKQDKKRKEFENKKKEYEEKGDPTYEGEIKADAETEVFIKVCMNFVSGIQTLLLKNIYTVAVHKNLKKEAIDEFIKNLDDKSDNVKNTAFIYKLFRNENFHLTDNPAKSSFKSSLFIFFASITVPSQKKNLLNAFAPLLISTKNLNSQEKNILFNKIKENNTNWFGLSLFFAKNPILIATLFLILLLSIYKLS